MSSDKVMLTRSGYNRLVARLEYLKNVRRLEIAERLKAAIALGDLSENSEYDDAKNEQGLLENEIIELEDKLRNSKIIQTQSNEGKITLGSTVTIRDVELDEINTYMIVGTTEADPDNHKISDESPLGAVLINKSTGITVQVHAPIGIIYFEILEVK